MQQTKLIRVSAKTHKQLKVLATKLEISITELVNRLYKTRKEEGLSSHV